MKSNDSNFGSGEKDAHRPSHHVEGLLVPSKNLNVLEAVLLQDFLDHAKLERVRPHDNRHQGLDTFHKQETAKQAHQSFLGRGGFVPRGNTVPVRKVIIKNS